MILTTLKVRHQLGRVGYPRGDISSANVLLDVLGVGLAPLALDDLITGTHPASAWMQSASLVGINRA